MDYRDAFWNLVAYCQRMDVLSADDSAVPELAFICGVDENDLREEWG